MSAEKYLAAVAVPSEPQNGIARAVWQPLGLFDLEAAAKEAVAAFTTQQAVDAFVILPERVYTDTEHPIFYALAEACT